MAEFQIPIEDAANLGNFYFTVDMDGVDYTLDFHFNDREGFWYMDVLDIDGNIVRAGLKVVINFPLLLRWAGTDRPDGELLCLNTYSDDEPGLEDLGTNAIMIYAT